MVNLFRRKLVRATGFSKYGPRRLMMAADLFGVRVLGRTMGIILVADGITESLFPMLLGALYNDVAKSYVLDLSF